jgi:DTW domain-containing protein YfiP
MDQRNHSSFGHEELLIPTDLKGDGCSVCGRRCWLYCHSCLVATHPDAPVGIKLPKKLVIFKDPKEKRSKSTAIHAPVLAPQDTVLIESKDTVPDYDPEKTLLLFPSKDAKDIQDVELTSFDRIIVIDGTWSQARSMAARVSTVFRRHVRVANTQTLFWRWQRLDSSYLSTIEAIYWIYRNMSLDYDGEYDGLLFFFHKQYELIQNYYKDHPQKKFISKKLDSDTYIRYDQ